VITTSAPSIYALGAFGIPRSKMFGIRAQKDNNFERPYTWLYARVGTGLFPSGDTSGARIRTG